MNTFANDIPSAKTVPPDPRLHPAEQTACDIGKDPMNAIAIRGK